MVWDDDGVAVGMFVRLEDEEYSGRRLNWTCASCDAALVALVGSIVQAPEARDYLLTLVGFWNFYPRGRRDVKEGAVGLALMRKE